MVKLSRIELIEVQRISYELLQFEISLFQEQQIEAKIEFKL